MDIISKKFGMILNSNDTSIYTDKSFFCKSNDSIKFAIKVLEGEKIKDLNNCSFILISIKNGKDVIEQKIEEFEIEDGALVFYPKKIFTSSLGNVLSELIIYNEDKSITTQAFNFLVYKSINPLLVNEEMDTVNSIIELHNLLEEYRLDLIEINENTEYLKTVNDQIEVQENLRVEEFNNIKIINSEIEAKEILRSQEFENIKTINSGIEVKENLRAEEFNTIKAINSQIENQERLRVESFDNIKKINLDIENQERLRVEEFNNIKDSNSEIEVQENLRVEEFNRIKNENIEFKTEIKSDLAQKVNFAADNTSNIEIPNVDEKLDTISKNYNEITSQLEQIENKKVYENGIIFFNHRGWTNEAPENTLEAFELSAKRGFKGVECDVVETRDGKFVIIHDSTVDRTTNGVGTVNNMTLEEIKALNIDSGNGLGNYSNIKVPTLEEFLECCKKNDLIPLLELKGVQSIEVFFGVLKNNYILDNCILLSAWLEGLRRIRNIDKSIKLMYLADITIENILVCEENKIDIDTTSLTLTKDLVDLAHSKNIRVGCYTPNTLEGVKECLDKNIDYITSDVIPYLPINESNVICGSIKSAGSTFTYENVFMYSAKNRAFSKIKYNANLQATKIQVKNLPSGFKVSIMPFDKNNIYFTDMGWNWGTLTNLPTGTKYVCLYFGKDDNTDITEADKISLKNIEVNFYKIENTTKCYGIQIGNGGGMIVASHSYDSCTVNFNSGFIELTHSIPFLDRGGFAHAEFYSDTVNYTARVKDLTNGGLKIKLYNNNVSVDDISTMYYSKLIVTHIAPTLIQV